MYLIICHLHMRCDTHVRQVCRWNSLKIGMIYMILIPVWNLWLEIFVWEGDREGLNSLVKAHLDLVHDLSFKSPTFFLQIRNHFLKFLRWQIQIIGISDLSVKSTIAEREADIHFIDDWSSAFIDDRTRKNIMFGENRTVWGLWDYTMPRQKCQEIFLWKMW